jgi:hypothetical protein
MMLLHQFLVTLLFHGKNGPDKNLPEVQGSSLQRKDRSDFLYTSWKNTFSYLSVKKEYNSAFGSGQIHPALSYNST